MKISYSWLKQFIQAAKSPEEISLILTNIGLEVESLEKVQAVAGGLEGLVIGEVLSCVPHPNADRLRVTQVEVGGETPLQIVCGAPNVDAGQKVVVAVVGTTVYPSAGEPFKINKSKIRGEVSEGMICAEDEIGLGTGHEGILVLPSDTVVGMTAKTYFRLEDDYVFEIGLTPNRADAASHWGVARDLAAYLRISAQLPDVSGFKVANESLNIPVSVKAGEACPRYSSVTISGVEVKDSPDWLKEKLQVIGIRPINNIVDVTNFVLHELGQPLHAFDADEIKGGQVHVQLAQEGSVFTTLDDVERHLSAEDLMICNAEEPMCIAGVFGGKQSGITPKTTRIFLESAFFNAVSVRKTSKRHGLKTDASFRFERGTDPEMTVYALKRAALLIQQVAGGEVSSALADVYPTPVEPAVVDVSYQGICRLIGQEIATQEIEEIIVALGMEVLNKDAQGMQLRIPAYKVDVTRECDVVEEVLRIYGYDRIAIPSKVNASLAYSSKPGKEYVQNQVADMLVANGFYEILCNSLTRASLSKNKEEAVQLLNPLSSDLNVMRQTLIQPALEAVAYNQKRKSADLKFFEFGKTYHLIDNKYVERPRLLILSTGEQHSLQWNHVSGGTTFYHLKAVVDAVLNRLGIVSFQSSELRNEDFAYGLTYGRGEKTLVSFGLATKADCLAADVEKEVFYADFDWELMLDAVKKLRVINKEVPKYPSVRRDLSLLVDQSVTFEQLKQIAFKSDKKTIRQVQVFDVYEGNKLPEGKKSYALNFTLQDDDQTLTDKQIDSVMKKIITNLAQSAGAEIR